MQFDFSNVNLFITLFGLVFAIQGLIQLLSGKTFANANVTKKYTEESLRRLARPSGFVKLLFGLACAMWTIVDITAIDNSKEVLVKAIVIFGLLAIEIVLTLAIRKRKS